MALIHADNFSIYGANRDLLVNGIYADRDNYGLVADPDGVSPGRVLRTQVSPLVNGSSAMRYVLPGNRVTVGVAQRIWLPYLPQYLGQASFIEFRDAANNPLVCVCPTPTGRLSIRTGINMYGGNFGNSVTLGETAAPVITPTGWYHMEVKVTQGGAGASSIEVRIEGATVFSASDLTFRNTNQIAQVAFSANTQGNNMPDVYVKDFVVWDTLGSRNNDWMGSVLVTDLDVTSDVALNWTPSVGSNGYSILDNVPPNDSQYISAPYSPTEPNYPDAYVGEMSDLPIETTSVRGIITYVRAAKSDGGDGSLQVSVISNPEDGSPAEGLGADRPITVAQTYWRDIYETDPATSGQWTPGAVNRIQLKINRTS